jgi:hypothetical protein
VPGTPGHGGDSNGSERGRGPSHVAASPNKTDHDRDNNETPTLEEGNTKSHDGDALPETETGGRTTDPIGTDTEYCDSFRYCLRRSVAPYSETTVRRSCGGR